MHTLERKPLIIQAIEFKDLQAIDIPEDASPEEIEALEAAWEAEITARFDNMQERFTAVRKVMEREQFLAESHDPEIAALKRELELREAGRKRHESHASRAKKYLAKCLEIIGTPIEAEGFTYKLQKNGGAPMWKYLTATKYPKSTAPRSRGNQMLKRWPMMPKS